MLRFSAFNQRTTPELVGTIRSIAADLTQDARSGESYYTARIALPEAEAAKLEGRKLVPGMPAEVHISTRDRTALSVPDEAAAGPARPRLPRALRRLCGPRVCLPGEVDCWPPRRCSATAVINRGTRCIWRSY